MPVNSASMNKLGANATSSNEIYIECKPTGDDGVILYKKSLKGDGAESAIGGETVDVESADIFQNRAFLIAIAIICCILFLGTILFLVTWMLRAVSKKKTGEGAARGVAGATA
jgi:preprotein translocase subunit SecG